MNPKRIRGHFRWAFLALGCCAGCESAAPIPHYQLEEKEWSYGRLPGKHLVTDHYDIYTTIQDQALLGVLPDFLEAAYARYEQLLPGMSEGQRLTTYAFATRSQWERFTQQSYPARARLYLRIRAGGYSEGQTAVTYYLRRSYTFSVLAHEGLHQFIGAVHSHIPAWLNEGLATYCESVAFRGNRPVFTPRQNLFRMDHLRAAIASDSLLELPELLRTDAGQVIVHGQSTRTQTYYAQAWSFVVFLKHGAGGRYAKRFEGLLAAIGTEEYTRRIRETRSGAAPGPLLSLGEAAFRAFIVDDLAAVDAEYRKFIRKLVGF